MGWWTQNEQGESFASRATDGPPMMWGDSCADAIDTALHTVVGEFEATFQRKPTKGEVAAGLRFSLRALDEAGEVTK